MFLGLFFFPDEPHSYCTFLMLRRVHMPMQHMCIEQDKKCFSFRLKEKQTTSSCNA